MPWTSSFRDGVYLRLVVPLMPSLPAWLAYGLALSYADLRRKFDGAGFREVTLSMQHVMPSESERHRRNTARDYFRNRVWMKVDAMRLGGDGQQLARLVEVHGLESLRKALSEGKGAILCSGHFGSVRACAGLLGVLGFPATLIANWSFAPKPWQRDSIKKAITWMPIKHHLRGGNLLAEVGGKHNLSVALEAAAVLKRNEIVFTNVDAGILESDLNRAITVNFLNGRSPVLPGPSELARFTGAAMLTVFLRRSRNWKHLVLEIRPVDDQGSGAMQECMTRLERAIWSNPAQWEHWNMRKLVRMGLYPRELAINFFQKEHG